MTAGVAPGPIELRLSSVEREDYRRLCELTNGELSQYINELSAVVEGEQNIELLRVAQELLCERYLMCRKSAEADVAAEIGRGVALGIKLGKFRKRKMVRERWRRVAWVTFILLGVISLPALLVGPFKSSIEAVTHGSFPTSPLSIVAVSSMSIVGIFTLVGVIARIFKNKDNNYLSFFGGTFPITGNTYGGLCNKVAFWNIVSLFVSALLGLSILFTGWYRYFNLMATMWWPFFLVAFGLWSQVSLWIIATAVLLEYTDVVPDSVFRWLCKTRPRYIHDCPYAEE